MHLLKRRFLTPTFISAVSNQGTESGPSIGTFGVDFTDGDLVLTVATRHLDNTIPSIASGKTGVDSLGNTMALAGVGSYAVRVDAAFVSGGAFTPGTRTNAQQTVSLVYRDVDPEGVHKAILFDQAAAANGTVVPYPALSWDAEEHLAFPALCIGVYAQKLDNGASVGVLPVSLTARHVRASGVAETRLGENPTPSLSFSALTGSQGAATTNGLITAVLALKGAKA